MHTYRFLVNRVSSRSIEVKTRAETLEDARHQALEEAYNADFPSEKDAEYEAECIESTEPDVPDSEFSI